MISAGGLTEWAEDAKNALAVFGIDSTILGKLIFALVCVLLLFLATRLFEHTMVSVLKGLMSELKSLAALEWKPETINALATLTVAFILLIYFFKTEAREILGVVQNHQANHFMELCALIALLGILTVLCVALCKKKRG